MEENSKEENGDWALTDGEEKLKQLELAGEIHKDEISSALIPLVKHFGYVFTRTKGGYVPGLGISGVTKGFEERTRIRMEAEAATKRVESLDQEVDKLKHLMADQESRHQVEIENLHKQINELLEINANSAPLEVDPQLVKMLRVLVAALSSQDMNNS